MACFDDKAPDVSEQSILFVHASFQMEMVKIVVNQILSELIYNMLKIDTEISIQTISNVWKLLGTFGSLLKCMKKIARSFQISNSFLWKTIDIWKKIKTLQKMAYYLVNQKIKKLC